MMTGTSSVPSRRKTGTEAKSPTITQFFPIHTPGSG